MADCVVLIIPLCFSQSLDDGKLGRGGEGLPPRVGEGGMVPGGERGRVVQAGEDVPPGRGGEARGGRTTGGARDERGLDSTTTVIHNSF